MGNTMLNYTKLWLLLESKGMRKTDLTKNKIISTATLAKLGKNEPISSTVIEKICGFLKCQPGDIMEYISEEQMKEVEQQFDSMTKAMAIQLQARGISEEMFGTMLSQAMSETVKNMFNGSGKSIGEINQEIVDATLGKKETE